MKPLILASLLVISFLPMSSFAKDEYPNAYERRGYKLGMSLTQFRHHPFPDIKHWPGAKAFCSNDPEVQAHYSLAESRLYDKTWKIAGVIKCKFHYKSTTGIKSFYGAGPMLAGVGADTTFYFIPKTAGEEPQLFLIETGNPTGRYRELKRLYIKALGEKPKLSFTTMQNKLGGKFQSEISTWSNSVSKIQLSQYGKTLRILNIRHVLLPLLKTLNKGVQHADSKRAGGL